MTIHGIISLNQPADTVVAIDSTDWAANGITLGTDTVNLYFRLRLTTSQGSTTVYDNLSGPTPDIIVVSAGQQATLLNMIPTGQDGDILQGTWDLTIRAEGSTQTDSFDELGYETYTLNYEWPEVCIKTAVFCDKAQVQSDDISDYGVYATNISRTHTLFPPPSSGAPSQVTPLPVNVYGPNIWSKTWTAQVISVVTFEFASNFTVIKQVDNAKEFEVVCSREICSVMCCVTKMFRKYERMWGSQKGVGSGKDYFSTTVMPGLMHAVAFLLQQNCGRSQAAAAEVELLKAITGCGDCDECSDDEPLIILPTVASTNAPVIVDSPLGSIAVTPELINGAQYFHIEVSQAIQTIINQFKAVTVSSANALIDVQPEIDSIDGHVNWKLTAVTSQIVKNVISYIVRLYVNPTSYPPPGGQAAFLIETTKVKENGDKVQTPTFGFGNTTPNTGTDYCILDVSDFYVGPLVDPPTVDPETPYEVHAQVQRTTDDETNFMLVKDVECEVLWYDKTSPWFRLRLYSPVDGQPLLISDLAEKDDVYIALTINVNDD